MDMFCYQCQETARGKGCTVRGVCGKPQDVAVLQDLLLYVLKGISYYGVRARELGVSEPEADRFVMQALFSTVTNVNFHAQRFIDLVHEALRHRDNLADRYLAAYRAVNGADPEGDPPDAATWSPEDDDRMALFGKAVDVGIMAEPELNEDVRSLRSLITYGLMGLAAYTEHAYVLEHTNADIPAFMQEALTITINDDATVDDLVAMVMRCGQVGVQAMALLDEANTSAYGHPEPTQVNLGVREGPAILISGHDLRDLDELLQQTAGKGINVYTHGEMLPAHAYPAFKEHPHLVGNYGGPWWHQRDEFEAFGGAILMTTNCLVEPRDSYRDRLFTTGLVGWPGVQHIGERPERGQKDFSPVIAKALESGSPKELETGTIPIGFAHNAVLSVADKVIDAIRTGAVKRFVVMAGCDGRHKERQYFTEVAQALPEDSIILTAGCAKYRYNKLGLGSIGGHGASGGIPRVLDAGQCNDSYSLVVVALKLAEALGIEDVNDLPIEYDIAWYEQKAVLVLLALLSLGVKHIRLGPTLPAFVSPNVLNLLVETFDIKPITTVEQDVAEMTA